MESSKPVRIARAYLLAIGIWSALSLLTGWNYLIFDQLANLKSTLPQMMLLAESRGLAYAVLTPPLFFIVHRFSVGTKHQLRYLAGYILGAGPFVIVCASLRWLIVPPYNPAMEQFLSRSDSSPLDIVQSAFADLITIYFATVIAAHAYYYLYALKMQLHPHFLFNTLHGISTLIDSDRKGAQAMIFKLSSLLRTALEHSGSDLVPLQDELNFIRDYLDIEQMRFGSRLQVTWSIDQETLRRLVPQLILQPLVENAVRHGVASSREDSWVEITSQMGEKSVELRIRNNVGASRPHGIGVGLRNTRARLTHLYSGEATFSFSVFDNQTAVATVVLPLLGAQLQSRRDAQIASDSKNG
ncbi:MAG: histidine kinase [Terracidiphilus sp.]